MRPSRPPPNLTKIKIYYGKDLAFCHFSASRKVRYTSKLNIKVKKMAKNNNVCELESYVPRHKRLGLPKNVTPSFGCFHDIVEEIPILDGNKRLLMSSSKHVVHPAKDTIGKFKASDFDITMLQAAGVPLDIVNVNTFGQSSMSQIIDRVSQLDSLEKYTEMVQRQQSEFNSFFTNPSNNNPSNPE